MSKWEYKIINIRSENYRLDPNAATQLNQLGEDGWELVSITSVNFKTGATDNIAMVFKNQGRRDEWECPRCGRTYRAAEYWLRVRALLEDVG